MSIDAIVKKASQVTARQDKPQRPSELTGLRNFKVLQSREKPAQRALNFRG